MDDQPGNCIFVNGKQYWSDEYVSKEVIPIIKGFAVQQQRQRDIEAMCPDYCAPQGGTIVLYSREPYYDIEADMWLHQYLGTPGKEDDEECGAGPIHEAARSTSPQESAEHLKEGDNDRIANEILRVEPEQR